MAWKQQTVTGRANAYQALIDFMTTDATLVAAGENWSNAGSYTDPTGDFGTGVYLKSPMIGTVEFYVLVSHAYHEETGSHNIYFRPCFGLTASSATDVNNNQYPSNQWSVVAVNDTDSIDCTLVGNARRMTGCFCTNGNYQNFYAGMFLPYVTPDYYPRPICNFGNCRYSNQALTWNYTYNPDDYMSGFIWEGSATLLAEFPNDKNYEYVGASFYDEQGFTHQIAGTEDSLNRPYRTWPLYEEETYIGGYYWFNLAPSPGGYQPLIPVIIYQAHDEDGGTAAVYGELDGVRYVPGTGQIAGKLLSDEQGNQWMVTQDGMLSGGRKHAAIRLA